MAITWPCSSRSARISLPKLRLTAGAWQGAWPLVTSCPLAPQPVHELECRALTASPDLVAEYGILDDPLWPGPDRAHGTAYDLVRGLRNRNFADFEEALSRLEDWLRQHATAPHAPEDARNYATKHLLEHGNATNHPSRSLYACSQCGSTFATSSEPATAA